MWLDFTKFAAEPHFSFDNITEIAHGPFHAVRDSRVVIVCCFIHYYSFMLYRFYLPLLSRGSYLYLIHYCPGYIVQLVRIHRYYYIQKPILAMCLSYKVQLLTQITECTARLLIRINFQHIRKFANICYNFVHGKNASFCRHVQYVLIEKA